MDRLYWFAKIIRGSSQAVRIRRVDDNGSEKKKVNEKLKSYHYIG